MKLRAFLKRVKHIRFINFFIRVRYAFGYYTPLVPKILQWGIHSKEDSTFTYTLEAKNQQYLIHIIALITDKSFKQIETYIHEILDNEALKFEIIQNIQTSAYHSIKDSRADYASRIAWYAWVRCQKPKIIVENGVEMGLTAVALCEALLRNKAEGHQGQYIGLDINPLAGVLIKHEKYHSVAEMRYQDTIEVLSQFTDTIDFYFSDGVRSADYESREFSILFERLSSNGVVVSNKMEISDQLCQFATTFGKKFIYFKEKPEHHWYPGSGIGICF